MSFTADLDGIVAVNQSQLLGAHASWTRVRICDVAEIQNGFPFESARFTKDRGTPLLRIRDVLQDSTEAHFDGEFDSAYWVEPGDLVVGMDGDFNAALWRGPRALLNQRVCRVTPEERFVLRRFIAFVLPGYLKAINDHTSAITVKHLSSRTVAQIPIPLPPVAEQRRIVEALETHFTRLDAAVATLKRVRANLRRYRAAVLQAAVEGRLVPNEAEAAQFEGRDCETGTDLVARTPSAKRPNRYESRSHDVRIGHGALSLGNPGTRLPRGWTWAPLAEVAQMESGHTPSRRHPEWWGGDVPWVGLPDARDHHGGVIYETRDHTNVDGLANSAARLLPAGTVCLSRTASVGYVVVLGRPMATSQDFANWICTPALDPQWLRCVLMADREALRRFGSGSVHTTIYFPELLSLHVAVPPLAEQGRIAAEVDRRMSLLAAEEAAIARCEQRGVGLRKAILRLAFEGRLVPQDPRDEPASVLFERLRHEHVAASPAPKRRSARSRR